VGCEGETLPGARKRLTERRNETVSSVLAPSGERPFALLPAGSAATTLPEGLCLEQCEKLLRCVQADRGRQPRRKQKTMVLELLERNGLSSSGGLVDEDHTAMIDLPVKLGEELLDQTVRPSIPRLRLRHLRSSCVWCIRFMHT
jgi:hypothetical protein